jgi:hypothetical protein
MKYAIHYKGKKAHTIAITEAEWKKIWARSKPKKTTKKRRKKKR